MRLLQTCFCTVGDFSKRKPKAVLAETFEEEGARWRSRNQRFHAIGLEADERIAWAKVSACEDIRRNGFSRKVS